MSAVEPAGNTPSKKPTVGTTGVQLCYYKKEDFTKLTPPQRKEVAAWTKANPSPGYAKGKKKEGGKGHDKSPKKWKSEISAMATHNNEMLEAMVEAQMAQTEAMTAQASAGRSVPGSTFLVQG